LSWLAHAESKTFNSDKIQLEPFTKLRGFDTWQEQAKSLLV